MGNTLVIQSIWGLNNVQGAEGAADVIGPQIRGMTKVFPNKSDAELLYTHYIIVAFFSNIKVLPVYLGKF